MDTTQIQLIAGSLSTMLFISSSFPMLFKVLRSRDVRSFSLSNILITNVGNAVYWLYVLSLPFGPIWLMHSFYTLTQIVLLIAYLRFQPAATTRRPVTVECQSA